MIWRAGARWTARALFCVLAAILLYLAAAAAGALVRVNADARPPSGGVPVWIESNGMHAGIILPWRSDLKDWSGDIPPAAFPALPKGHDHLMFGWGERAFYLGTPTWADFDLGLALGALLAGTDTLLHVQAVPPPSAETPSRKRLLLSPEQYRRLAAAIRQSLKPGQPITSAAYGGTTVFFPSAGRYSPFVTCNVWTGGRLAEAGVRVGAWTPFAQGLLLSLEN